MIQLASFITAACLFLIGLWAISFKDNMVKKVMGVTFITDAVNLTLVAMGFRLDGIVPILMEGVDVKIFRAFSAYPLPQALVLTNIVIGVATTALMLGILIKIYGKTKSLSAKVIWSNDE